MVPSPADVSPGWGNQPFPKELVVRPESDGKYQCTHCPKRFLCHEPYEYHAIQHHVTIKHIYIESKQLNTLKLDVKACHGVYCDRSTHFVRITISQLFGSTSSIQQVDEELVLTFGEFREKDFISTEKYNDTLKMMEEFDSRCCGRIQDTIIFGPKNFLKLLRSCFPTPKWFRSSYWPSTPNPRATSLYLSAEATTANDAHLPVTDDLISITSQPLSPALSQTALVESTPSPILTSFYPSTKVITVKNAENLVGDDRISIMRQSKSSRSQRRSQDSTRSAYSHLSSPAVPPPFQTINEPPENFIGIVAVDSFYSTPSGVHGNVVVITQSCTVKLLEGMHLGALLEHTLIASQLQEIVGKPSYKELLEFEKTRKDIWIPIYSGVLPDDFLTEVGKELQLEDCSPMLQAQVRNILGI